MNNKSIRCLIVDDEPQAHEVLKSYMQAVTSMELVGSCFHGVSAMELLREKTVDLMFVDIHMPQLLGTEFVKALSHPPKIIFVTAHRNYAMDGFDLGVVDYLLKPVSFERFLKAINKFTDSQSQSTPGNPGVHERFLYFRADRKMVKVLLRDINYIESLKDYVRIMTLQGPVITKLTLSALHDMLPEGEFLQIHRSFIAPISRIDSYTRDHILIGKAELPVGPLFRNTLLQHMEAIRSL